MAGIVRKVFKRSAQTIGVVFLLVAAFAREQAIDYMLENTGNAESDVISEIERYIVIPGQATAYKVGMMELLRLRQEAQDSLGDKFDIRDFHDVVLKDGALPLTALRELVMKYIAQKRST